MTRQTFGSPVLSMAWQSRPDSEWMPMGEADDAAPEALLARENEKLLVSCAAKSGVFP